ncbi:MAG: carboxypeptidase regulatory-like domain-containing protein [Sphingomonadales bacterium]|uniref:MSCRAMM family protein n=1 Tax=Sphingorhabdus sp. TaxID=1902408 RepID=UPI003BB05168|nr:carboxypeptidase regulatory-like domain-containing protein [Sphingomonadales bacterium]MBK9432135.1 carboxypeptidase regulatory-like domain-containing protein [Sphingomonadales bacterium]
MHASEWTANDDDSLLLDLRVGQLRVGNGVRGYQTDNGVCVDLSDIIMSFDLPVRLDKKSRRATGWLFEESRTFTLDRDDGAVQIMNKRSALSASDIRDVPEGWCVATQTLSRWLNVELKIDLSNALLVVVADRKLPFELAEERKARVSKIRPVSQFDLKSLPQANDPYRFWRTPSIDVVASVGGRKDSLGNTQLDRRYEIYASGEVAHASFDARLASDERGVPESLRLRAYRTDPDANLFGPLKATQFAIGDVSTLPTSLGVQSTVGRGAFLTNRPIGRPDSFDRTTFRGELPDGWDAELYRNDQLIGYTQSRGNGRYEFVEVPLQYGQNRFEIVLYGPQGQIRRDVRMIPVGPDSIPPRETYYWASVQDAGRDLVNFGSDDFEHFFGWRGGVGVERGIDARTSVAASLFSAVYDRRRDTYLEGSVRRAIGPTLVELAAAANARGGYAMRGQLVGQLGETAISAESIWLHRKFRSERYDRDLRSEHSLSLDHSLKIGSKYVPVSLRGTYRQRLNGESAIEASGRISFNIKQINASTEIIWEQQKRAFGSDPPGRLDAIFRLSGRVGGLRLRGESRFALAGYDTGFRESKVTGEWRAGEKSDWRTELGYDATNRRGRLAFGHTRRFRNFALTGQVEAATDGAVAGSLSLAFSLGPNPGGGGIRVSSEKLAAHGQAMAVVFQDSNGDGYRQADEPVEKEVEITAGLTGKGEPTDKTGRTIIGGLAPFVPVLIGIDASSLPDPFIQPANSGVVVTPRPGVPMTVELPLVAAGEVSGTLVRSGGRVAGGIEIELLDRNGRVVKTTKSEYDGYFLFERVPYGQYRLRLAAVTAAIIKAETTLNAQVELTKARGLVDIGTVEVRDALRIAAADSDGSEKP